MSRVKKCYYNMLNFAKKTSNYYIQGSPGNTQLTSFGMVMNSEIHNKGEVSILTNIVLILFGSSPTEVDMLV